MANSSSSPMRLLARAVKRHGLRCAAAADCGEGVSDAAVDGRETRNGECQVVGWLTVG